MPPSPRFLSLSYAAAMGAIGAFGPYFGLVLDRMGYSAAAIGGLLAIFPLTRIGLTPVWSVVADRFRLGTRILQFSALVTAAAVGAIATGWLPMAGIAVALVAFAVARAPVAAVLDGLTVRSLEDAGLPTTRYGRIRLWGSVAFLICTGIAALLAQYVAWAPAPLALAAVVWGAGFFVFLALPNTQTDGPVTLGPALRALARKPGFLLLVIALPLHGLGLNAYDSWYAMHVESRGLPSTWTGVALACGLVIEIGVLGMGQRLLQGRSPASLVAFSMATAAVRWALTALVVSPVLLTVLQSLHGVVYGVFWIGLVELFRRLAGTEVRASAQAVAVTATYGFGSLLTSGIGGAVVDRWSTDALFGTAAVAAAVAAVCTLVASRRIQTESRSPE